MIPRYFALSAIAALFKYLETTRSQYFPPRSLWIRYAPLDGTMLIDMDTAANLELVANVTSPLLPLALAASVLMSFLYAVDQSKLETTFARIIESLLHSYGNSIGNLVYLFAHNRTLA